MYTFAPRLPNKLSLSIVIACVYVALRICGYPIGPRGFFMAVHDGSFAPALDPQEGIAWEMTSDPSEKYTHILERSACLHPGTPEDTADWASVLIRLASLPVNALIPRPVDIIMTAFPIILPMPVTQIG